MLSRIAESLFWIGRYLERAEDTTRIVEVHLQLLLDEHPDGLCLTLTGIAHPDAQSSSLV